MSNRLRRKPRVRLGKRSKEEIPSFNGNRNSEWVTTAEAAAHLRISTITLAKLRVYGGGPPFYKDSSAKSGRVYYRRSELDAWRAAGRVANTSQFRPKQLKGESLHGGRNENGAEHA